MFHGFKYYIASLFAVRRISPRVVYLNSLFSIFYSFVPFIVSILSISFPSVGKFVVAPRGELDPAALSFKPAKKFPFILFYRLLLYFHSKKVFFHSTSSSETLHIQHALNLSNSKIYQISNIPRPATRHIVDHEKTLLSFPLRIVFLSRIVPKKNLDYAIKLLKTVKSKVVFMSTDQYKIINTGLNVFHLHPLFLQM